MAGGRSDLTRTAVIWKRVAAEHRASKSGTTVASEPRDAA